MQTFASLPELVDLISTEHNHERHLPMAPEQRDLGRDDCFASWINLDTSLILFGHVLSARQVDDLARVAGRLPSDGDGVGLALATVRNAVILASQRNMLLAHVYTRHNTSGSYEMVHRAHVWPIPVDSFAAAQRHNFDIRNMAELSDMKVHQLAAINEAYRANAAHIEKVTGTAQRRPYGEFFAEAESIAQAATSHNYGATVWRIERCGDREVVMRLSSWPRMQEAKRALLEAGLRCREVPTAANTLAIRDRTEADYTDGAQS